MSATSILHAWVDESIHIRGSALSEGIYLLAATVADPRVCDPAREALRSLLPGRASRLHWKDSDARSRRRIALVAAGLGVQHTVVIGAPLDARRQERARRLCMERLLHELGAVGVSCVWAESRTASLNRQDLRMIDALRSRHAVPPGLKLEFMLPSAEPMLWLPDIAAGAVGLHRRNDDPRPYETLRPHVTVHDITI